MAGECGTLRGIRSFTNQQSAVNRSSILVRKRLALARGFLLRDATLDQCKQDALRPTWLPVDQLAAWNPQSATKKNRPESYGRVASIICGRILVWSSLVSRAGPWGSPSGLHSCLDLRLELDSCML